MHAALTIFWFRRDLRLNDNAGLYHALRSGNPVLPLFIFDTLILEKLEDKDDARMTFIHQSLNELENELQKHGSSLLIKHGQPEQIWRELINEFDVKKVICNHDYEPYAIERDGIIAQLLEFKGIDFNTFKDQAFFEKNEVLKDDEKPYTVFTPYKKKWLSKLNTFYLKSYPNRKYFSNFYPTKPFEFPTLDQLGFIKSNMAFPDKNYIETIEKYDKKRDFPAEDGTSHMSVHLRFGTVSIRELARTAFELKADAWLNELIWRDFYFMILWHFPHVVSQPFKQSYRAIKWRNNETEFEAWCQGQTGYPIVDAGMRQLNTTGFMHNRIRMIVASFLTKHLLIDWRWGEAYFARKLLDFELSSNNGGWQWAAGTGCDAAPYFRIFNPDEQTKKFDSKHQYIKRWVPELKDFKYPPRIIDHKFARERCLKVYKEALNSL